MLPFELTKDTRYLALSGELWSVFNEYFNSNWSCYKGFLLYYYCREGKIKESLSVSLSLPSPLSIPLSPPLPLPSSKNVFMEYSLS